MEQEGAGKKHMVNEALMNTACDEIATSTTAVALSGGRQAPGRPHTQPDIYRGTGNAQDKTNLDHPKQSKIFCIPEKWDRNRSTASRHSFTV